ncbi:MAG TPA: thioredoxin domain-containing protein [Candidatus Limnocylindria bacterium]|nr:thioredoxin domain-containing protein [Candidatus Limnocylindria bacterium]
MSGAGGSEVVATVDGTPITRAALEAEVKPQLIEIDNQRYEVLAEGLEGMIAEALVEKEAKTRGVSADQLIQQEVTAKLSAPSDADIQKVYDANKAQLGGATLEQVKDRIVQYLQGQQEAELQQQFITGLRDKYKTTVALKPPKVEVADGGAPSRGPANAPVTIIEFSDYECPFCKRAEPTVEQVVAAYPDKVRLVYRHYPLPFHKNARPAAEAAMCANAQGKFWEYHEKLWEAPALDEATLKKVAGEIGLDQAKFDACLANKEGAAQVDKDMADASAVGVRGTPAFFINGRMLSGAQPFDKFKVIIEEELAS